METFNYRTVNKNFFLGFDCKKLYFPKKMVERLSKYSIDNNTIRAVTLV